MKKKSVIFAKPRAHGIIAGVISQHHLRPATAQLVCDCSTATSQAFWENFGNGIKGADRVIAIDYSLPTDPKALRSALRKIRQLTRSGVGLTFVTYQKPQFTPWGYALEEGARVIMAGFPQTCYFGGPSEFSKRLSTISSICSWHPVEDATGEERTIAAGIHKSIRTNLQTAITKLRKGDLDWFRARGEFPSLPPDVTDDGRVAFTKMLDPIAPVQHLCEIASRLHVMYAVGIDLKRKVVVGVRNWAFKRELAVPFMLGMCTDNHGGAHVTMEGAAMFRVNNKTADDTAAWLAEILREPVPTELSKAPGGVYQVVHHQMGQIAYPRYLTDHNWPHLERVVNYTMGVFGLCCRRNPDSPLPHLELSHARQAEGAAILHDLGQGADGLDPALARYNHHVLAPIEVVKLQRLGVFQRVFDPEDIRAINKLSFLHRGSTKLPTEPLQSLCGAITRLGDGLDVDYRRSSVNSYGEDVTEILAELKRTKPAQFKMEDPHFAGHRAIKEVRLVAGNDHITIDLVVTDPTSSAFRLQLGRIEQEADSLDRKGLKVSVVVSMA